MAVSAARTGYRCDLRGQLKTRPAISNRVAFNNTGFSTNDQPRAVTASPPITAASAVAPAGGCVLLVHCITSTAIPTAKPADNKPVPRNDAHATPTVAAKTCPPTRGQGCDKGLCGVENNKTAEDPIEVATTRFSSPSAHPLAKKQPTRQAVRRVLLSSVLATVSFCRVPANP